MFTADVSQDSYKPKKTELLRDPTKQYTCVPGGISKL